MVKIRQAIVVEGKYDQNTLSQLVDTTIFQTRGFGRDARQDASGAAAKSGQNDGAHYFYRL